MLLIKLLLIFFQRRETWCPGAGAMLSSNPLESAAALAQSVLSNFDSSDVSLSSSSEESDTNQSDFMSSNNFVKLLAKEERKKRSGEKLRKVKFSDNPPRYDFILVCSLPSLFNFLAFLPSFLTFCSPSFLSSWLVRGLQC